MTNPTGPQMGVTLYSFTTYSHRKAEQGQNFRLPTITNTITNGDSLLDTITKSCMSRSTTTKL